MLAGRRGRTVRGGNRGNSRLRHGAARRAVSIGRSRRSSLRARVCPGAPRAHVVFVPLFEYGEGRCSQRRAAAGADGAAATAAPMTSREKAKLRAAHAAQALRGVDRHGSSTNAKRAVNRTVCESDAVRCCSGLSQRHPSGSSNVVRFDLHGSVELPTVNSRATCAIPSR